MLIIVLRLFHIVLGAIWVGVAFFSTFYLGPAFAEAGPDGAKVMGALQRRGMMSVMPIMAVGTLVSGAWLYWIVSDGLNPAYVHSRIGGALAAGGLLALAAWLIGMIVMRPAMMRVGALSGELARSSEADRPAKIAEIDRLRVRGKAAGWAVMSSLFLAIALMAVARYL